MKQSGAEDRLLTVEEYACLPDDNAFTDESGRGRVVLDRWPSVVADVRQPRARRGGARPLGAPSDCDYTCGMDIDALAVAWRSRAARQRTERRERAERARADARRAAEVLRGEFGVDEVWLFGSLASEPRHDAFDIDLAVRGLRPDRYFTALARIGDLVHEPFDVVTLETCRERIRRVVDETGVRIDGG